MSARKTRFCARCTYPMTELQTSGAVVDHCHRCGGTAVEPQHLAANVGEWADPKYWMDTLPSATTGERLVCPVDAGSMTGYQIPFGGRSVVVDHCDSCGTLWLDEGEGAKLVQIVYAADHHRRTAPAKEAASIDAEMERRQETEDPGGAGSYLFQLLTGMPVEVWNPVRGNTPVTITLLLVICSLFAVQMVIALTSPTKSQILVNSLGLMPLAFFERPWGLITYAFLHGGLFHLVGNAYFLHVFGDNVEDRLGPMRFLAIYFVASIVGGLLHLAIYPGSELPVVGASGAIAGLMGAYIMLFPKVKLWVIWFFVRWRIPVLVYFGFWVLMQFALAAFGSTSIAWTAHLGGFAVGILGGWLWRESPHPLTRAEQLARR